MYEIIFPIDFDEYLWEYQAKGWVKNIILKNESYEKSIEVYDYHRFMQDFNDEIKNDDFLFFENILLVKEIDKEMISDAIISFFKINQ